MKSSDIFISRAYKIDATGDCIVRTSDIPLPSNAEEETAEKLERTNDLAKFVEVTAFRSL